MNLKSPSKVFEAFLIRFYEHLIYFTQQNFNGKEKKCNLDMKIQKK